MHVPSLAALVACLLTHVGAHVAVSDQSPAQLPVTTAGDLLVASSGNDKILRLAFDGSALQEYSVPGLAHPRGIVVAADGTIFVVSQNTNEVFVLDNQLSFVRKFATTNVTGPTGAAFGPNGNLFVGGFTSNNVGEYKTDGSFVRVYSGGGLTFTNCVAFRSGGGFFAASAGTGKIVEFTAGGSVVGAYTGFGLSSPMGIAISNGEVFVAGGGSNNVVVFDLKGAALRQIQHADLSGPQGIAFQPDGTLVASNYYNHKITWFRRDGSHVRTVLPASSRVPRSLAFLPGLDVTTSAPPLYATPFTVTLRSRFEPGLVYVMALALADKPGIQLGDGRELGLAPDFMFAASLGFPGFVGLLDARGEAAVPIVFPRLPTTLRLYQAALTIDPLPTLRFRQVASTQAWDLK